MEDENKLSAINISNEPFSDDIEFVEFEESESLDQPLYRAPQEIPSIVTKDLPSVNYNREFQSALLETSVLIRNVALVGHLQHGKSSLVDMFVQKSHFDAPLLFTNTLDLEKTRKSTLKTKIVNLVVPNSQGKSYSVNFIDTPGHTDFWDQLSVGVALCDTVLLVLDVTEPLLPTDLTAIEQSVLHGKTLCVCLNKLDKLVIDQQRNVQSSISRIYYVLDQVNTQIEAAGGVAVPLDTVLFASTKFQWSFTLGSVAKLYQSYSSAQLTTEKLARPGLFAKYVLEPIFKLFYVVLSGDKGQIVTALDSLGIEYHKDDFKLKVDDLLIQIFGKYFECSPLVDILAPLPPPLYDAPVLYVSGYINHGKELYALARILSGTFIDGQQVHTANGSSAIIKGILVPHAQYNMQTPAAHQGNIVLLGGIADLDGCFVTPTDSPTITAPNSQMVSKPIIKVGVEPFDPQNMPIFNENLELLKKTWPGLELQVEGTGEHLICGPGELYLDSALYSLRHDYQELEIRVSDPFTQFRETVVDDSNLMCTTETPDGSAKFSFLAEPAFQAIIDNKDPQNLKNHGWDQLTIDSILKTTDTSFLVDESRLPGDEQPSFPSQEIIQGYTQYLSAGPLCNEPVFGVTLKMSECEGSDGVLMGQIAPTVRRACLAGHMVAVPRIMEPVYGVICLGPEVVGGPLAKLLKNRRGELHSSEPVPGTNFFIFKGELPALDSSGFETEVRGFCHDLIQVNLVFDRWQIIPGDPLNSEIKVRKLERAAPGALARDIVIKIRKRKGLSREPDLGSFVDSEVLQVLD